MPTSHNPEERIKIEMAKELTNNYDYIIKFDALKFLRELYPNTNISLMIEAYNLAYDE